MGTQTNKQSRNDVKLTAHKPQPKGVSHVEPRVLRNSQNGARALSKPTTKTR